MSCCPIDPTKPDLAPYITQIATSRLIEQALLNYYDQSEIDALIADFIDSTELADALSSYVTNTALTAALAPYALTTSIIPLITSHLTDLGLGMQTPTLINGWQAFGGGYSAPGYYRYAGRIWFQGTFKNTTSTEFTQVYTLPSTYRPLEAATMRADSGHNQSCRVHVYSGGGVWFQTTYRAYVCMDGLSVRAQQLLS